MEYQVLTDDHKRAMWEQQIAHIEQNHFALAMERDLLRAVVPKTGTATDPQVRKRLHEIDEMLCSTEQQHAEAVRQRGAEPAVAPEA